MPERINKIRKELNKQLGKEVTLTAYESRNKVINHTGILANTYPSLFIIELEAEPKGINRISYSYSDILTGHIELTFN